jgi:hypothetical protein
MQLQHRLSMLEKMVLGPKHERFIPASDNQLSLEMALESAAEHTVKVTKVEAHQRVEVKKKDKIHPGRNPLPSSLRREEIILEPAEDVSGCLCIGEEISEVLEIKAAEFFVKRTVRKKYARKNDEGIAIASLENRVIDKGIAGASVLAMLIVILVC